MEESTATHDTGTQEGAGEPDPFAEVPADLGEESLPPGVQPGSLGGDNPSEEQEPEPEPEDPLAEEPTGGEFLEEPTEPDDGLPEEALPAEPEQPEGAAPPPPPAEGPPPTPDEPSPAEPATPVEGSAAPPSEEPLAQPTEPEAEADVPPPAEEEPSPAEEPSIEPGDDDDPPPAPAPAEEPPAPEGEEPKPSPEPKKRKRKPRRKKAEKGQRGYVILKLDSTEPDHAFQPGWVEAFDREVPIGEKGSEPVTIDSRSAEMALRIAYRRLTENGEASMWLVPVPVKLFKPRHVEGKVPENALTIKVN